MRALWTSPLGLLLITGGLLGLSLPFGKLATDAGVSAILWSLVISAGAGAVLFAALIASGHRSLPDGHRLRYFAVTGAVSYAIPNLLLFSAMPHLGAGYTGIMFTLTPLMTLALSILTRLKRPNALAVAGIAVGFAGALTVATTRGEAGQPAELFWVLVGLTIPVFLSAGNLYRTLDWPQGAAPIELAAGSNVAAAALVLAVALGLEDGEAFARLSDLPWLVLAQAASAATMFAFFFRLQAVGGPVYLSQIGYVGAAVGLIAGTVFLGERYEWLTWIGAGVISVGVAMTTLAQREAAKPSS